MTCSCSGPSDAIACDAFNGNGYDIILATEWLEQGKIAVLEIYKYILIYIPKYEPYIKYVNNITSTHLSERGMYISRYILINTLRI